MFLPIVVFRLKMAVEARLLQVARAIMIVTANGVVRDNVVTF